jgi:hypothetical protein
MTQDAKESFLKNVANHKLTIIKDDGLYRHIRLKAPGTSCRYFDIVTWPGHLAYTGDMGSYTFTRVKDMFEFFRDDDDSWGINPRYWSEKVVAMDNSDKIKNFCWDKFVTNLMEECETDEQKSWMKSELKCVENDEFGAVSFVREFDNDNEAGVDLSDFWERSSSVFSSRYLWCCYALVWAIRQYDAVKAGEAA